MDQASPELPGAAIAVLSRLDRIRRACLKALGTPAKIVVVRRDLRVTLAGTSVVLFSLAATLLAPFWLLALGPIFLGTPHLVADLRYLVFRPRLHLRRELWLPVGVPLILAGLGYHSLISGLVASSAMALLAQGATGRKLAALGVISCLMVAAVMTGPTASLVFAHLHNFIAVMLWWCWRPRAGRSFVVPGLFLIGTLLLGLGIIAPWSHGFAAQPGELTVGYHLSFLAPGLAEPWALRLVLLYAFAQSVHYGIWLRLIPEDDRAQPTPRTFAASTRALRADLGLPLLAVAAVIALGIALWAAFDLATARENYLRMALFHGHLEIIAATWLFVERPARGGAVPARATGA